MTAKPIRLSVHAITQARERKASLEEIEETIRLAPWQEARRGRLTAVKRFPFGQSHYGRKYDWKDVVPVFVDEPTEIVVVTVYTYFSGRRR